MQARRAGGQSWLHPLVGEYLRTLLSWTLLPKWRLERPLRGITVRAIADAGRDRWGSLTDG